MESSGTGDFQSLYKDMANFDFTKPINVVVTLEKHSNGKGEEKELFYLDGMLKRRNDFDRVSNKRLKTCNNDVNASTSTSINQSLQYNSTNMCHYIPQMPQFERNQNTICHVPKDGFTNYSRIINTNNSKVCNRTALDTISKYFIEILRAGSHYIKILRNRGANYLRINAAKHKLQRIIQYYFCISRDIAVRELLPYRYNTDFIRLFLERTRYMAMHEDHYFCLFKDVECIYNNFIVWLTNRRYVEKRQTQRSDYLCKTPTQALNTASNTSFCDDLENESIYKNVYQQAKQPDQGLLESSQINLFRFGKPGEEVSLDISSEIFNKINRHNNMQDNERNQHNSDQVPFQNKTPQLPYQQYQAATQIYGEPVISTSIDSYSPFNFRNNYDNNVTQQSYGMRAVGMEFRCSQKEVEYLPTRLPPLTELPQT